MNIPTVHSQLFLLRKCCGTHLAKSTFSEYSVMSEGIFGYWLPKGKKRRQKLSETVLCCKQSIELNILLIKPDGCRFFAALVTRPLCKWSSIISHTETLIGRTVFVFWGFLLLYHCFVWGFFCFWLSSLNLCCMHWSAFSFHPEIMIGDA